MDLDAEKLVTDLKALIERSKEQGDLIKTELDKIFQAESVKAEEEENIPPLEESEKVSETLSKMKISQIMKLRKF